MREHSWMVGKAIIDPATGGPLSVCRICHLKRSDPRAPGECDGIANYPEYPDSVQAGLMRMALEYGVRDFNDAVTVDGIAASIQLEEYVHKKSALAEFLSACLAERKVKWKMEER